MRLLFLVQPLNIEATELFRPSREGAETNVLARELVEANVSAREVVGTKVSDEAFSE